MKSFSLIALLALATATIASPVPEAEAEAGVEVVSMKPRGAPIAGSFTMWKDRNFSGARLQFTNLHSGDCVDLASGWNDVISSAGPTSNVVCTLWENFGCKGRGITLRYPGSSDLNTVNFNDQASSVNCA